MPKESFQPDGTVVHTTSTEVTTFLLGARTRYTRVTKRTITRRAIAPRIFVSGSERVFTAISPALGGACGAPPVPPSGGFPDSSHPSVPSSTRGFAVVSALRGASIAIKWRLVAGGQEVDG